MSQSIPVPARKHAATPSWSSSSVASSSSYSATPSSSSIPTTPSLAKGKFPAYTPTKEPISHRRPSLLELFLPSYADYDALDLEHKAEPVQDIILTDEEAAAMLPQ
ncbi:hypothetical protein LTR17_015591 [Elasticomyces elasticus]|nr:hypothetical protein LTR17_015591 [Elasticomyces elasticus]